MLTSLKNELPLLAGAAPEPFLMALEQMLEGTGAAIRPIFDEVEGFAFPSSNHTGVLWALETLEWLPTSFRRACLILADLAAIDPGKLVNRPNNSLRSILLSWRPCTLVDTGARFALIDEVITRQPQVAWKMLLSLLPDATTHTSGTARPRLRGSEALPRTTLTYGDVWAADQAICGRAIMLASNNPERMHALIGPMLRFPPEERDAALTALDATLEHAAQSDREALWIALHDQLQRHRRFATAEWALGEDTLVKFDEVSARHAPDDPVLAVSDLFGHWIADQDGPDLTKRRADAVGQLAADHATTALLELFRRARMWHLVFPVIEDAGLSRSVVEQLARQSFANEPESQTTRSLFGLFRRAAGSDAGLRLAADLWAVGASDAQIAGLFFAWPVDPSTWASIASLGDGVIENYWRDLPPMWMDGDRHTLLKTAIALSRHGRCLPRFLPPSTGSVKFQRACCCTSAQDKLD